MEYNNYKTPQQGKKKLSFGEDFIRRIKDVKPSRWIRFSIVSLIFFLWVVWLGNPWVSFAWLLLLDIYILQYVPWGWWKNKKGITRTVMSWVDAIFYALFLVYFIFAFIGQNYTIPSSSLEKSLLVGDYLWVNKALYGPRVPMTPLHFPLAQHTLPIVDKKSYIENPQFSYHRLPGIRSVERGDIVVFNYPQGDTVTLKIQNPDYYQLMYSISQSGVSDPRRYIEEHPETFGEIIWRPVDRRENYVKRCIGLPGDRLKIVDDQIYINGEKIAEPENVQYNYIVPVSRAIPDEQWIELGVRRDDRGLAPIMSSEMPDFKYYNVPLTAAMKKVVEKWPQVAGPLVREKEMMVQELNMTFPLGQSYGWTPHDMGEFWIPKRGSTIELTLNNLPVYDRAIRVYEGKDLQVKDGEIYIDGVKTPYYTFEMDYYWMMGDNRDRSLDSRFWGFVPEDHVVGSPMMVLLSLDEEKGILEGKIRTDRILRNANPDKDKWK